MVELSPGTKVYVYQSDKDMAMKHGLDHKLSAQQGCPIRDGTKIARYVMSLFWSEKELIGHTITPTPRNKDLVPLDINLLSAILDFCVHVSSSTRAQVKEALRNKVTAANTRAKCKKPTTQSIPDHQTFPSLQSNDQQVYVNLQSSPSDQQAFTIPPQDIFPDQEFNMMPLSKP